MDITPPVRLLMSWCTAYDASTHVNTSSSFFAPKHLFYLRVQWTNFNILLNFPRLSTSLFDTLNVKKLTSVSKSGLDLFIINNKFATTKWKNSPFVSISCLESFLTSNYFLVARYVTNVLTFSPNIPMNSSNGSTISTYIVLSFIYILITNKLCLFNLTTYISPKCFFTSFMMSDTTSGFLWNNLLSSTYQAMVHCVPSTTLFVTHIS